ncbi:MAG TPA: LapA family protein [Candidatus Aminicenantes bacterium]|nr:LapA family protein [Candidatus Aminicenantes bacterium]
MKAKLVVALALVALLAVLFIQNTQNVTYRLYFWSVSISQMILVPLIALLGFLVGFIVGSLARKDKVKGA